MQVTLYCIFMLLCGCQVSVLLSAVNQVSRLVCVAVRKWDLKGQ